MTASASPDRSALHAFLERHRTFLLTTHINPDGDGIGSEVAMALWLLERGKTVHILNDSPLPSAYRFLSRHHPVETWTPELAPTEAKPSTRSVARQMPPPLRLLSDPSYGLCRFARAR